MKYLFDASTLVPLLVDFGAKIISKATKCSLNITELTVYKVGNAMWKLATLLKHISLNDALEIMSILQQLIRKSMINTISLRNLNIKEVMELACNEKITFYDASYIVAAKSTNAVFVTEDRELMKIAKKHGVKTLTYSNFKKQMQIG